MRSTAAHVSPPSFRQRSSARPTTAERSDDSSDDDLLVVTGRLDGSAERLAELAAGGKAIVVVLEPGDEEAEELCGVRVSQQLPRSEWFVTLGEVPAAIRLVGEVPVVSALRTLEPLNGQAVPVATTSVRFAHQATITVRNHGSGRIIALGIADHAAVRRHPVLGTFIKRLARPSSAPSRDFADSGDLQVAMIGYGPFGGMGYTHGLACAETEGLTLAVAVDTAQDRLDAAKVDFPDLRTYLSAEAAAADDAIDVAIIATPPSFHSTLALDLLRAGKHVVVEKPMCLTVAEADQLIAVAEEHDRVITVHQSRRWDRDYLALERAVTRGQLGAVFNMETFVGGFDHPCRAWHSETALSGGAVYDWGSHHIDWILQLFGSTPKRVLCSAHTRVWHDTTNVDQLSVWMQWADGREATFRQSDVAAIRRPKFYVQGTEGTIEGHYRSLRNESVAAGRGHVDGWHHHAEAPVDLTMARYESDYGIVESHLPAAPHPGWGFHRNLADHLLLGESLAVPPAQSREVVRVLEAAHRSGDEGGSVITLDD